MTPNAVQCVLRRLKRKLGLKQLSAHQFRRTWATNYRKHGVGDLFDLQQEGGWEDLEVPAALLRRRRLPNGRTAPSVMDRWEQSATKELAAA